MKPQLHFFPSLDSTNDHLKDLIRQEKAQLWDIVWADYQSAGKGQRGNKWDSEDGENLLFSTWFKPHVLPVSQVFELNKRVSLAVRSVLVDRGVEGVSVKWPNDILVNGRKIAGVLIENNLDGDRVEHVVIGIGLNVNQVGLKDRLPNAISLREISGQKADRMELLNQLHQALQAHIHSSFWPTARIDATYLKYLYGFRQWRTYLHQDKELFGRITGISSQGLLQMNTDKGSMEFDLREIRFLPDQEN
ncbi:biotin--[acetyl-CoA-carboxylase] ligase [bacterium SCSIO 12741]|nr:biotin--[acetyl-CoA-carboxylase] ligase [bacterium SCSIO 12741]